MIHKAGTRISAVAPYDGIVGQSAAACLQWVRIVVGTSAGAFRIEARHGIHALVPSMTGVIIAARLGPTSDVAQTCVWE